MVSNHLNNEDDQQKLSFSRRIASYISSMNFTKVFRRQHHRDSSSPNRKSPSKLSCTHPHRYPRPFSYHIPTNEQLSPSTFSKVSNVPSYRIGLSSDSTLLDNGQTNENDDIVRLPVKHNKIQSPKMRKDRRHQSQLHANKRWLFRSMEALDGWKEKVFPQRVRTSNSSQSRSQSVENLAVQQRNEKIFFNKNLLTTKSQSILSPDRSIEAITNRVISSIGIHRKSTNSIPNQRSSPALTVKKQSIHDHNNIGKLSYEKASATILDFREISSFGYSQTKTRFNDEIEHISLTQSETQNSSINNVDDEREETTSHLSYTGNESIQNNKNKTETNDSWDWNVTWIDSLKELNSPQCKIQFYENLIKLLEQDTLNIDELLVLRKVLAKIWPIHEDHLINFDHHLFSNENKPLTTSSLHIPNKIKPRPKLSTMTYHTAQRCSAIIERVPYTYEKLNEQNSGHDSRPSSKLFYETKATPCLLGTRQNGAIESNDDRNIQENYPQHLNPFNDETDIQSSAPIEEINSNNNDSIRRYFERLTLLETIYEKLNNESSKAMTDTNYTQEPISNETPISTTGNHEIEIHNQPYLTNKLQTSSIKSNALLEMNVDGNGSISSSKSSAKRPAPIAPHVSRTDKPTMFTLSSADLNSIATPDPNIPKPLRMKFYENKIEKEHTLPIANNISASCDDNGQIFVYESHLSPANEQTPSPTPKQNERIQQWLSKCDLQDETNRISPANQFNKPEKQNQTKVRCISKPIHYQPQLTSNNNDQTENPTNLHHNNEQGRYRSSVRIDLEPIRQTASRNRASSSNSRCCQPRQIFTNDNIKNVQHDYFQRNTFSSNFHSTNQAVFL